MMRSGLGHLLSCPSLLHVPGVRMARLCRGFGGGRKKTHRVLPQVLLYTDFTCGMWVVYRGNNSAVVPFFRAACEASSSRSSKSSSSSSSSRKATAHHEHPRMMWTIVLEREKMCRGLVFAIIREVMVDGISLQAG